MVRTRRRNPTALVVALLVGFTGLQSWLAADAGARPPAVVDPPPASAFAPVVVGQRPDPDPRAISRGRLADPPAAGDAGAARSPVDGPDRWGLALAVAPTGGSSATGPVIPEVVRFRPRDGWTDVSRTAELSVRFTTAMDRATTELAFEASIDGVDLAGTSRWAEGDTVLVFRPETALPYAAAVELRVGLGAASAAGVSLTTPATVTFRVQPKPAPRPTPGPSRTSSSSGWQWPLLGPITQYFGQTLTKYGFHQGIDIDGDTGDPVRVARAGVVVVAGYADQCGGLQVRIDLGGGLLTWYRHLSSISTSVGASVGAGTVIGRVGNTGCSLGSHLHFGVSRNGEFLDPLRFLPPR